MYLFVVLVGFLFCGWFILGLFMLIFVFVFIFLWLVLLVVSNFDILVVFGFSSWVVVVDNYLDVLGLESVWWVGLDFDIDVLVFV